MTKFFLLIVIFLTSFFGLYFGVYLVLPIKYMTALNLKQYIGIACIGLSLGGINATINELIKEAKK